MLSSACLAVATLLTIQTIVVFCTSLPAIFFDSKESLASTNINSTGHLVKRDLSDEEKVRLEVLRNDYKGIWCEEAYPGAGTEKVACTMDQFNILAESTRVALELADFSGADIYRETPWSHRFFVRNSYAPEHGRWTSENNIGAYGIMNHNMLIPQRFPRTGKGSGKRGVRVTYQCQDPDPLPPDTTGCAGGNVPAYTISSSYTRTGWTTVFCPKFFLAGHYLNDIISTGPKTIDDFGSPSLISYEQMMIHEWMHADVMGYTDHIEDKVDGVDDADPVQRPIYGMSRCRDWAWKYMRDPCCAHINRDTVWNADNYAWYFSNKYYAKVWGWTDDGSPPLVRITSHDGSDAIGTPAQLSPMDIPKNWTFPANCYPTPVIDSKEVVAIGCDFDPSAVLDPPPPATTPTLSSPPPPQTGPCDCDENSCTPESPACCASGSCP